VATVDELEQAAAALAAGRLVVYPTETLYALGADATSEAALSRLLDLKGRDAIKGMSVLVSDVTGVERWLAASLPPSARALAERFWPGALTIVVPATERVPRTLVGASGGIGFRCSPAPDANALLARFGRPITATSANPSSRAPAATIADARDYFGDRVAAYIDDGARVGSIASTVVEFFQGSAYLRRAGVIPVAALQEVTEIEREG